MRKLIHAAVLAAAIAVPLTAATAPAMAGNSTQFPVQSPQNLGPAPACLDGSANLIFTVDNGHSHSVTNNNVARSPRRAQWQEMTSGAPVFGSMFRSTTTWPLALITHCPSA